MKRIHVFFIIGITLIIPPQCTKECQQSLADLSINVIAQAINVAVGQPIEFTNIIKNSVDVFVNCLATAEKNQTGVEVEYRKNPDEEFSVLNTYTSPFNIELAPGHSATHSASIIFDEIGEYKVKSITDYSDDVKEWDETNNTSVLGNNQSDSTSNNYNFYKGKKTNVQIIHVIGKETNNLPRPIVVFGAPKLIN